MPWISAIFAGPSCAKAAPVTIAAVAASAIIMRLIDFLQMAGPAIRTVAELEFPGSTGECPASRPSSIEGGSKSFNIV